MNTGSDDPGEVAAATDEAKEDRQETSFEDGTDDSAGLGSRAPEFIQARRLLHLSWQVGIFLVGFAVVVAGIIMLPLPGPGWVVIFGGMAIWATEASGHSSCSAGPDARSPRRPNGPSIPGCAAATSH